MENIIEKYRNLLENFKLRHLSQEGKRLEADIVSESRRRKNRRNVEDSFGNS